MTMTIHSILTDALFDKSSTLAVISGDTFQMTLELEDQLEMDSSEWWNLLASRSLLPIPASNQKSFFGLQELLDIPLYLTSSEDNSGGYYSVSPSYPGQTPLKTLIVLHAAHVSLTDKSCGTPLLRQRALNGLTPQDTWQSILSSEMKDPINDWLENDRIWLPSCYSVSTVLPKSLRTEDRARCKVPRMGRRQAASECTILQSSGDCQLLSEIEEGSKGFRAGLVGVIRDIL